jgi:hypothetical protein
MKRKNKIWTYYVERGNEAFLLCKVKLMEPTFSLY